MFHHLRYLISVILLTVLCTAAPAQVIDSLTFVKGATLLYDSAEDQLNTYNQTQIDSLLLNYTNNSLFRIEGHTDDVGSLEYNNNLAERRANSVMNYLTDIKQITASAIFTDSYGELKPAQNNITQANRKYNRRVDLSIYHKRKMRTIRGVVKLDSNENNALAQIILTGKNYKDSTFTQSNGEWSIIAPDSTFVKIDISAPNHFFKSKRIKITEVLDNRKIEVELPKLLVGKVYDMPDFFFQSNSPRLLSSSDPTLHLLYETMAESNVCIHIKGHVNYPNAAPVPESHNYYKLSQARARTVFDFLISKGIKNNRLKYNGYGNWEMVFPKTKLESQMAKNRRVEIAIIDCKTN